MTLNSQYPIHLLSFRSSFSCHVVDTSLRYVTGCVGVSYLHGESPLQEDLACADTHIVCLQYIHVYLYRSSSTSSRVMAHGTRSSVNISAQSGFFSGCSANTVHHYILYSKPLHGIAWRKEKCSTWRTSPTICAMHTHAKLHWLISFTRKQLTM